MCDAKNATRLTKTLHFDQEFKGNPQIANSIYFCKFALRNHRRPDRKIKRDPKPFIFPMEYQ